MKWLGIFLVTCVAGDVYFHNPRGSNDRLNEKSAARTNANRLFDSQNNNRGGYNVGDSTDQQSGADEGKQYRMKYFQSSKWKTYQNGEGQSYLTLEWTNQHGCGGNEDADPHKQNCNIVIQYMCQDDTSSATGTKKDDVIRNGVNTKISKFSAMNKMDENEATWNTRRDRDAELIKGLHEPWSWYDKCYMRRRNEGLFTADKILRKNKFGYSSAIYTRQNPNGQRYGYECPEERDYYPYWHPTAWKDIAVLTDNSSMCQYYQSKSFNVKTYGECVEFYNPPTNTRRKSWSRWNNPTACVTNGGEWIEFSNYLEKAPAYKNQAACEKAQDGGYKHVWAVPYDSQNVRQKECLVALDTPECQQAPWTRSNHLGNARGIEPSNYTWILPHFPSEQQKRCVLRIRYNISTDDYDPLLTDHRQNEDRKKGIKSPVQQNPVVDIGGVSPLKLAINTAQFGRIFQDRSHAFIIRKRPDGTERQKIFNLNVRGKRGNIVQVYPAVEYDFFPSHLHVSDGSLVHIQWTGSNSHRNENPAGDGQAGADGEGTQGTDRHNLVQTHEMNENFPVPFEQTTMWQNADIVWIYHGKKNIKNQDLAVSMATSGYYRCIKKSDCPEESMKNHLAETKATLNNLLNNAPASFEGVLLRLKKGKYYYMCTRNNNFTNRSQKGSITVL